MPRNNQRTDVSRQELQRLEARLTSLAGRTARQASDSDELPVDAVDTVNIANDAVTEDKIADGAVTFKKLASGGTTSGGGGNYSSQAETRRSGATETVEVYYTARPDGDGYAESEVTTSTPAGYVIKRKLYFSDKFNADPDTAADWTLYTTQPADNTAFATAKASLLAGLSNTDGTANTRGTLPVSLKMEHRFSQDLLLEDFPGAAAAYSLRKISSGYTGSAIRIREDGTNTETDIGFDSNGDLDTAAIATHCGSNNGFVKTWYDQSGNGNDISQASVGNQPEIYDGSNVHTSNGKPSVAFDQSTLPYLFTSVFTTSTTASVAIVCQHAVDATTRGIYENGSSNGHSLAVGASTDYYQWSYQGVAAYNSSAGSAVASTQTLLFGRTISGSSHDLWKDGSSILSTTPGTMGTPSGSFWIGAINAVTPINGRVQEFVLWDNDQSANRTDIEADISAYWTANKRTLDAYPGAAAAYSVRKLDNDYTGSALRVREDSGNTEADIGFDSNGDLDTAAIASHCGSANGFVVTWYDQSGNAYNATQSTIAAQPKIYNGSSVITDNNKPAVEYDGSDDSLQLNNGALPASIETCSTFTVQAPTDGISFQLGESSNNGRWYLSFEQSGSEYFGYGSNTAAINLGTISSTQRLLTAIAGATQGNAQAFVNGTSKGSATRANVVPATNQGFIGRPGAQIMSGKFQEAIVYHSDESANRTGIESDIDTYYGVTTQLLLDTYSGAAAAYSVRKLSQWYTGNCMRIREDSGDTETDIGFDSNGDLDTAAIASHCGSANGYVVTWYDQSGNGRDATQATAAAQPQIYNGTAVLTDNGKPKLSFDGSNDWMQLPDAASVGTTTSSWLVGSTFMVGGKDTTSNAGLAQISFGGGGSTRWQYGAVFQGNEYWGYGSSFIAVNLGAVNTNQKLYTSEAIQSGNASAYINGSLQGSVSSVIATMATGAAQLNNNAFFGAGRLQELVIYRSEQSTNRTGIESNINAYFSIF